MTNLHEPQFEVEGDQGGFRYRRARLGYQAGCERLGVSLWELPSGEATPYGYHYGNEELLIVLAGAPRMRTPEGWQELREGDLVAFPVGERGAHQFLNRTDAPVRLLMFSEMRGPEVTVYPDSQKIGVYETMMSPERGGFGATFRIEDSVDYYDREKPPDIGGS
jgi:uncharacterized cupin superfamily protein